MRVVLLGPPGSGKGTQGKLLAERLSVPAVSTGDILRSAVKEGSPLGRRVQTIMERGDLVSDDLIVALMRERIGQRDARGGFILDGFPRTIAQARALDTILSGNGDALSAVINLSAPQEVLVERMLGRAQAEGRADDRPETIRERLRVYEEKTEPLIDFYRRRDLLTDIDGTGSVPEIAGRIESALMSARGAGGPA